MMLKPGDGRTLMEVLNDESFVINQYLASLGLSLQESSSEPAEQVIDDLYYRFT